MTAAAEVVVPVAQVEAEVVQVQEVFAQLGPSALLEEALLGRSGVADPAPELGRPVDWDLLRVLESVLLSVAVMQLASAVFGAVVVEVHAIAGAAF